jgi:hypothetical protein
MFHLASLTKKQNPINANPKYILRRLIWVSSMKAICVAPITAFCGSGCGRYNRRRKNAFRFFPIVNIYAGGDNY